MIRPKSAIKRYGKLRKDIKKRDGVRKEEGQMKRKNVYRSKRQKQKPVNERNIKRS